MGHAGAVKTLSILLLSIAIAAPALVPLRLEARIGETEQQIEAHYGKPTAVIGSRNGILTQTYASQDFIIVVSFSNGASSSESFRKKDNSEIPQNELNILLMFNSAPDKTGILLPQNPLPGVDRWRSDKPARIAVYDKLQHTFLVAALEFVQYQDDQQKLEAAKKMKGF